MSAALKWLDEMPLVGILRGLKPEQANEVGEVLYGAGLRAIEVPLNSPDPLDSIARLAKAMGDRCLVGAGTVLSVEQAEQVHAVGGQLLVSPNCNPAVIARGLELGMAVLPGVGSVTEAFAAVAAGTRHLKLFPAVSYGSKHLKAMKDVLPPDTRVYPVGGVGPAQMAEWVAAGAAGFGIGGELFRPGYTIDDIARRAAEAVQAYRSAR